MEYRRLGGSGVLVSEVALGSWLTFGHALDQGQADACVKKAFDVGINFIDTADVYALGACESALGKSLQGMPRKDYVLASKVFFPTGPGPNDKGLSRKHIVESCEASLERLGTDYLDLYQCHRHDPDVSVREVARTMDDLIRRGSILYWGVSLWPADRITEAVEIAHAHGWEPPVSNQPVYNLLQREIEEDVLPVSEQHGVGQVVFSPLAQGLLTGKYRRGEVPKGTRAADDRSNQFMMDRMTDETFDRVEKIRGIAEDAGLSMARLALAWCLRHEGLSSVIMGASKPEQVEENATAAGTRLDEDVIQALESV